MLPEDFSRPITSSVKEALARYKLPAPRLVVEPGRYIVGDAGTTLYRVGSVKDIPEVRKYVFVDGEWRIIRALLYTMQDIGQP